MKKISAIIIVIASTLDFSYGQNCPIDNWVQSNYLEDSRMFAIEEIRGDSNHIYKDSLVIPDTLINKYLGLFSVIYNDTSAFQDSIFNIEDIHVGRYEWYDTIFLVIRLFYKQHLAGVQVIWHAPFLMMKDNLNE